jgi:hypothetical protein
MNCMKRIALLVLFSSFLTSCNLSFGCPDAEIEWVDLLMIDDVKYQHPFTVSPNEPLNPLVEKGEPLGDIEFKMADKACSDHKMKNGDAAYIEEGTMVYAIKGYPSSLMVMANEKVYVADENADAKTIGDLYQIKNLVKNIHLESKEDGSRIHTFTPAAMEKFLEVWLKLELVDSEKMARKNTFEGERIFLEIELNNRVSFRQLYWSDTNAFNLGAYGNEKIQEIIKTELARSYR